MRSPASLPHTHEGLISNFANRPSYPSHRRSILFGGNLVGTLPDEIGAFTDVTNVNLGNNQLTGTIPSSVVKWTHPSLYMNFAINQLYGQLPQFSWANIVTGNGLLEPFSGGKNAFACPLPSEALTHFHKADASGNWVPITAADCSTACYGASKDLSAAQCTAWQTIYDALKGDSWKTTIPRSDPCGPVMCGSQDVQHNCVKCVSGSLTQM